MHSTGGVVDGIYLVSRPFFGSGEEFVVLYCI